jgi:hypothetical protein
MEMKDIANIVIEYLEQTVLSNNLLEWSIPTDWQPSLQNEISKDTENESLIW